MSQDDVQVKMVDILSRCATVWLHQIDTVAPRRVTNRTRDWTEPPSSATRQWQVFSKHQRC